MGKLLFVLAEETFRDTEFITPKALLEQNGVEIETTSSINKSVGRFGYKVIHNFTIAEIADGRINALNYDGIVLVGGLGSLKFIDDKDLENIVQNMNNHGKLVAAICAAPRALLSYGILNGKNIVGNNWDNNFEHMASEAGACYMGMDKGVERDGNIITAYGPENVEQFANEILSFLSTK